MGMAISTIREQLAAENQPRAYDLADIKEQKRLIREVVGYMAVSLRQGTDFEGRQHALTALKFLEKHGATFEIKDDLEAAVSECESKIVGEKP